MNKKLNRIFVIMFLVISINLITAHTIQTTFYDENSLSAIPTVTITDSNGSTYTSDVNGLWTVDLTGPKDLTISKTGYDSRLLQFNFNADANYNFLLNPTELDSNISFIVKDSNNNLWGNKYLMFSTYKNLDYNTYNQDTGITLNNTTTTTESSGVRILIGSNPIILNSVTKHNSVTATKAYIKTNKGNTILDTTTFIGNVATFTGNVILNAGTSYRIEIGNEGATYNFLYKTSVLPIAKSHISYISDSTGGSGTGDNLYSFTSMSIKIKEIPVYTIINSLLTSSQGYATGAMKLTSLVAGDYNAYLYDADGNYIEQVTPTPIVMDLNFSEATSGQVFYENYIESFTNVTSYALALGNVPNNTLITVLFNNQMQKYELLYKNKEEFEVGKVNLKVLTFSDYNGVVFVKPLVGQSKATDATIKAYIYESGAWKMIGQAYSTYEDGQAYFYTRINDLLYFIGQKDGYSNVSKSTSARLYWTNVDINIETLFNNRNLPTVNLNFWETSINNVMSEQVWTNYATFNNSGEYITNKALILNIYIMSDVKGTWTYKKYEDNVLKGTYSIGDNISYGTIVHTWLVTKNYKYEFYYNDELVRTMNFKYDPTLDSGYVDYYGDNYDISNEAGTDWKDKDIFFWLFMLLIVLAIIGEYVAKAAITVFVVFGVIFSILNMWILITISPILFYVGIVILRKLIVD